MRSVLVVDDNKAVRDALSGLFQMLGWTVKGEADNGAEAVHMAVELKPDLVVLDFSMPFLNGVETASILKNNLPDVCIIVFTVFDSAIGPRLTSAAGIDVVVSKAEGLKGLTRAIQSLMGSFKTTDGHRPAAQD